MKTYNNVMVMNRKITRIDRFPHADAAKSIQLSTQFRLAACRLSSLPSPDVGLLSTKNVK